eukprot:417980_1
MRPSRTDLLRLIQYFNTHSTCPAHSIGRRRNVQSLCSHNQGYLSTTSETVTNELDTIFEFKAPNLRFGRGVTSEVGQDLINMGIKNVCVVTDPIMANLPPIKSALDSIKLNNVNYEVYDQVSIEPTDTSFEKAINFVKSKQFDGFVAVGGGSTIDTAKAANLYSTYSDFELFDFVNAPIGKGLTIPGPLKPLIAIPTTSGTGSESTGTAVFDIESMHLKTGISGKQMTPSLGLIDPNHTIYMPDGVVTSTGFDVLCHALESYTCVNFDERLPKPSNPKFRPLYHGANPIGDIWSETVLPMIYKYFIRAVNNADDYEAREQMLFSSCFAGQGLSSAGAHLPHGMSYAIAGINHDREYCFRDYNIMPHGVSVIVTAPAVFECTVGVKPDRHRNGAIMLGVKETDIKYNDSVDIGRKLKDILLFYMHSLNVPFGLKECGFNFCDIDDLVKGAIPQKRLLQLAPNEVNSDVLAKLFENAMSYN